MIKDVVIIKDDKSICWVNKGCSYAFYQNHIDQFMVDESRQLIFVLSGYSSPSNKLDILDDTGMIVFSSLPPPGSTYYYLTKTPSDEVLVVCSFERKNDNWYDWHYSFDLKKRELHYVAPAY